MAGNLNSGMCSPLCSDVCAFYLPQGLTWDKSCMLKFLDVAPHLENCPPAITGKKYAHSTVVFLTIIYTYTL